VEQHDSGHREEIGYDGESRGLLISARRALQDRDHPFDNIIGRRARRVGLLIRIFHPITVSMRSIIDDLVLPLFLFDTPF
jgi:hypothetical protein